MIAFTDRELDEISLLEGALALNTAIKPNTPTDAIRAQLELMASEAELRLAGVTDVEQRLQGLLQLFYKEWGFKGDFDEYFDSQNTFVEDVITRRKGIPVSLGALLLFFAQRLLLPVKAVGFPTQLILRIDWPHRRREYLDPFNGEIVSTHVLHGWLIGREGSLAQLLPEHTRQTDNATLIRRWLTVMKSAFLREENYLLALRCSAMALSFDPNDPHEIRDRGYIFQQLNCGWVAADDYQYFIDQCPDDPAVDLLKAQVQVLGDAVPVFH
ncbi:MAG: SirB1 family protein [Vibrionaceae bacterium]